MVGFGFVDNTVMIQAGNLIDLTLGVTFGLSTLAAAACGQICSDVAGVSFGSMIEACAEKLGLPPAEFTHEQSETRIVKAVGMLGGIVGVISGCSLGLLNLLLINAEEAGELKMAAATSAAGFTVEISNTAAEHATAVVLEGPEDIDGVIAAITTSMAAAGAKIVDMEGHRGEILSLKFYIKRDGHKFHDDDLEDLGRGIMKACHSPVRVHHLSKQNEDLKRDNAELQRQVEVMEAALQGKFLKISKSEEVTRRPSVKSPQVSSRD